jgi:hypothetical protein
MNRIRIGEIIAPRFWFFSEREKLLCGPSRYHCWVADKPTTAHGIARSNNEGVYAFREKEQIHDYIIKNRARFQGLLQGVTLMGLSHLVIGTVRLWGCVTPAERGYRAQYGRVHSLDELFQAPDFEQVRTEGEALDRLRSKYGLGVKV